MSTKPRKQKAQAAKKKEEEAAAKPAKKASWSKPTGAAPLAWVNSRRGVMMVLRQARGFSMGELEGAAVSFKVALRWGVPLDVRRRTVLSPNTETLTKWFSTAKKVDSLEEAPSEEAPKKRASKKKAAE